MGERRAVGDDAREEAGCISQSSTKEAEQLGDGDYIIYGFVIGIWPVTGPALLHTSEVSWQISTKYMGCRMASAFLPPCKSPRSLP